MWYVAWVVGRDEGVYVLVSTILGGEDARGTFLFTFGGKSLPDGTLHALIIFRVID